MLKRYHAWQVANPLPSWLVSAALRLVALLGLYQIIPGQKKPGFRMFLVVIWLTQPTLDLIKRFSDEQRQAHPISPGQEQGVGVLALIAAVSGIGAFVLSILGGRWGWSMDRRNGPLLLAWVVLTMLSLAFGQAGRFTSAGRWGMRLTIGGFAVLIAAMVIMMLRGAGEYIFSPQR